MLLKSLEETRHDLWFQLQKVQRESFASDFAQVLNSFTRDFLTLT